MKVVEADFNARDRYGNVLALKVKQGVDVDDVVLVRDDDGNSVQGRVVRVVDVLDSQLVHVEPDWATWAPHRARGTSGASGEGV